VKKSKSEGQRLKEAASINSSLLGLGNVMAALAVNSQKPGGVAAAAPKHVPYRDSKLTFLLQHSFALNCRTHLIVCISQAKSNALESIATLQFGSRAMNVAVNAHINASTVRVDPHALAHDMAQVFRERSDERATTRLIELQRQLAAHTAASERTALRTASMRHALLGKTGAVRAAADGLRLELVQQSAATSVVLARALRMAAVAIGRGSLTPKQRAAVRATAAAAGAMRRDMRSVREQARPAPTRARSRRSVGFGRRARGVAHLPGFASLAGAGIARAVQV
jgi:hypothetical protein